MGQFNEKKIRSIFEALKKKEEKGEVFRDFGGMEPVTSREFPYHYQD